MRIQVPHMRCGLARRPWPHLLWPRQHLIVAQNGNDAVEGGGNVREVKAAELAWGVQQGGRGAGARSGVVMDDGCYGHCKADAQTLGEGSWENSADTGTQEEEQQQSHKPQLPQIHRLLLAYEDGACDICHDMGGLCTDPASWTVLGTAALLPLLSPSQALHLPGRLGMAKIMECSFHCSLSSMLSSLNRFIMLG